MMNTVVYCSDGNDLHMLAASLYSVKKFMPDATVYVLSDVVSPLDVPDVKIADPTAELSALGFFPDRWGRKWPYATLYRLAIPLMQEFSGVDRVLYLDTDTLVKSGEVAELFAVDMGANEVLGTRDTNGTYSRIETCVRCDLCQDAVVGVLTKIWNGRRIPDQTYINAGVTVWNLARIRENGLDWYRQRLKWFWEAELRGRFRYLDQDFINSMMLVQTDMPAQFNAYMEPSRHQVYDHPVVRHYVVDTKDQLVPDAVEIGYVPGGRETYVVYSSDGNDGDKLRMSMRSVKKYIGPGVKFFILTELEQYPGVNNAVLVNPAKTLADLGFSPEGWNRRWPYCTLFRLALPLLPELQGVDRVLYLDTDTLVRSPEAMKLFRLPIDAFEVCGAPDVEARQANVGGVMKNALQADAKRQMYERLWRDVMPDTKMYINAGVAVWNLDRIRENGLDWYRQRLKWFWEAVRRGNFGFLDQDFINSMMNTCAMMNTKFNKFGGDASTRCAIQHFVASTKKYMADTARKIGIRT
jgi:lipopolysaccharide biosynthesis glycosyltransferase